MSDKTMLRIATVTSLAVVAVTIAVTYVATVDVPELHMKPRPYATTDVPRCTDKIADAGGVCYGEPLPPCATEDSSDCYWDAATMGNGIGRSFIVVNDVVTYTDGEDSR